jgi:hypothetical protein
LGHRRRTPAALMSLVDRAGACGDIRTSASRRYTNFQFANRQIKFSNRQSNTANARR